jgi:hypothetical protein
MNSYLYGPEQAAANGFPLARIRSMASFFVFRVDVEDDADRSTSAPRPPGHPRGRPGRHPTGLKRHVLTHG